MDAEHQMEWSRSMSMRRVATAALLLALVGAACAGSDKPVQVLGESFTRSSAPSAASSATTTVPAQSSAPLTTDTAATVSSDTTPSSEIPETTVPTTGTITVNYQPHDGGTATATLEETGQTTSLESGSAVFADLAAGTYTVHVTIEQPGTDPATGTATYINRSRPIELRAGDSAVIQCDDTGCSTGVL
jgi:ABC-type glycerol-3-phosphate transport system substrate-binding protein